jgi:hypothetical protein
MGEEVGVPCLRLCFEDFGFFVVFWLVCLVSCFSFSF